MRVRSVSEGGTPVCGRDGGGVGGVGGGGGCGGSYRGHGGGCANFHSLVERIREGWVLERAIDGKEDPWMGRMQNFCFEH